MSHYKVESPLLHDSKRYAPGDHVEMGADIADPLVKLGRLTPRGETKPDGDGETETPAPTPSSEIETLRAEVDRLTAQIGDVNESYAAALDRNERLVAEVEQLQAKLTEAAVNDGVAEGAADKPAATAEPAKPKARSRGAKAR